MSSSTCSTALLLFRRAWSKLRIERIEAKVECQEGKGIGVYPDPLLDVTPDHP
jgi:hypothetical protein